MDDDEPLQQLILHSFGHDLPISGGYGGGFDDAIVIHENYHGLAVELEYLVTKFLYALLNHEGYTRVQERVEQSGGRYYDVVDVESTGENGVTYDTTLYFDITEAYRNIGKSLEELKNDDELELIKSGRYWHS